MGNQKEKEAILGMLRLHYGRAEEKKLKSLLAQCDNQILHALAARIGLDGFLHAICQADGHEDLCSHDFQSVLLRRSRLTAMKNNFIRQNLIDIVKIFSRNDLAFIVLKGIPMVRRLYDDLACREVKDIDILINRNHIGQAIALLESAGFYFPAREMQKISPLYTKEWVGREMHEIHFVKGNGPLRINVDLHTDMSYFNDSKMNQLFPVNTHDWFGNMVHLELDGLQVPCLNNEFSLLNMIYHFSVGHSMMGIKWLVDICQMLKKNEGTIDWQRLEDEVQNPNLRKLVAVCLAMTGELIGEPDGLDTVQAAFNHGQPVRRRRIYRRMLFKDAGSIKGKINMKFFKVALPASFSEKMQVLTYYLFDKSSIKHRISGRTDRVLGIFLPFLLIKTVIGDFIKKKRNV